MKWRRIIPTLITLSVLVLGFKSILASMDGRVVAGAQLIVLAAIVDGLDGEVARLFKGITAFGAKLDTYVDTISFGVAPAILVYQAMWKDIEFWGVAVPCAVVISAAIRFARYNYSQSRVGHHTFRGLPIPVSAIWMAMFVLFTETDILADSRLASAPGPLVLVMWSSAIAFLVLQVSNVRYAKPTKEMIGFGLGLTVLMMIVTGRPAFAFSIAMVIAMFLFAFTGPLWVRAMGVEEEEEEEAVSVRHP